MGFAFFAPRRIVLVAVVSCLVVTSSISQADEPLRWKFTAGEKLDYQMTQDMNMDMDAGPAGKLATNAGQTMSITWIVKSIDEKGDALIEQTIDRIHMNMTAPGGQGFDYDTDSEEPAVGMAAMIAPTLEAMTAGKFTFTMSPRGEVRDLTMTDELLAAIRSGPGGEKGAIEQFKAMVSQVALVLPENPPKLGDEWTIRIAASNPAGGNQTVDYTFKYEGTREVDGTNYAVIKPTMKLELANNPMMEMKMKEQQTQGEVLFNLEQGRLHSNSIHQDIALDVVVSGQELPGTIDQKSEIKLMPRK
ncbi:MAG: DUF6263 family protein [Pirellulales bacterium]